MNKLKRDHNIVMLLADKGRMTVVMNKAEYIEKVEQRLRETRTYRRINEDLTKRFERI